MRKEQLAYRKGYRVTELGSLINPKGKVIGSWDGGYFGTSIVLNKIKIRLRSHRLQAFQKYGTMIYEKGILVRHADGNPTDNTWGNIIIGTPKDNMMDIPEQIRIKKALHASSFVRKYNKEKVRKYYEECKSYKSTMSEFSISSKGTLHYILNS